MYTLVSGNEYIFVGKYLGRPIKTTVKSHFNVFAFHEISL
jgi:hypothetical protein